jgi:hypothetical protein
MLSVPEYSYQFTQDVIYIFHNIFYTLSWLSLCAVSLGPGSVDVEISEDFTNSLQGIVSPEMLIS